MLEFEYDKTTKYQAVKDMEKKIREEIKNIGRRIEWKQNDLDKAVESFKESAASYDAYHIETFLPGKIEEIAKCKAEADIRVYGWTVKEDDSMDNKKIIETIEKKLSVKVEKVLDVKQDGKEITVDVKVGETSCRKVILKEAKNQYSTYFRFVSASEYEVKKEMVQAAKKKPSGKLRTKTEQLCGARRNDIISFAEKNIGKVADGSARIKEIEGAALDDTVIRFVLLMSGDNSRFKEDIAVSAIREAVTDLQK